MLVEVRSITSAPFCRCGRSFPVQWTQFDLPPHVVSMLREERALSVRDAAFERPAPTPAPSRSEPPPQAEQRQQAPVPQRAQQFTVQRQQQQHNRR
jgi:hypothetical protein